MDASRLTGPLDIAQPDLAQPETAGPHVTHPHVTHPHVGATLGAALPRGYRHLDVARAVGSGRGDFERARAAFMAWRLQRAAGFGVAASPPVPAPGTRVLLTPGAGLLPERVRAWLPLPAFACVVVAVVDEPDRAGFAYGTLPGHPESGEELFLLTHEPATGAVVLRIRAFSREGTRWSRALALPVRLGQRLITARYLRALG